MLAENAALPPDRCAIYAAGSLVRGWGNGKSDLDIYLITEVPWQGGVVSLDRIWAPPGVLPVQAFYWDGRRWDVEHWLDSQVDEVLRFLSWERFEAGEAKGATLTDAEIALIHRLGTCEVIEGSDWIKQRHQEFDRSAVKSVLAAQALYRLDLCTEDAIGMLEAGDAMSAVLAARQALGFAVDALMAVNGEFERSPKWRAKRMLTATPDGISFEDYWSLETMNNYDPRNPDLWINDAMGFCQRIAEMIEL